MGCDYYILKILQIYHNENDYLEIEIDRNRGYYNYYYDSDDEDYDDKVNKYIEDILRPQMDPIVIYNNNSFNKLSSETKYKFLIENKINKYNIKWYEVTKVIKVERRFERG